MPIKYLVNQELKLLCTLFYGIVDKNDAFEYVTLINNDSETNSITRTLVLLKESELIFNLEDVESFSRKLAMSANLESRDKIAILVESPNDTVVSTIFSQTLQTLKSGVSVELFYILDAAIQFLGLANERAKVDNIIETHLRRNGQGQEFS